MAYLNMIYSEDMDFELYFRENALTAKRIDNDFLQLSILYESADESKKPSLFSRMATKVKELLANLKANIQKFIRAISQTFGGKSLTPEDYMNSGAAEVRINGDIQKITEQIQDELLKERKGVQAIAKAVSKMGQKVGAPIDMIVNDKMIADIVDKANAFVVNDGPQMASAAITAVASEKLTKAIRESAGLTDALEESRRNLEKKREKMHDYKQEIYEKQGNILMKYIEQVSYSVQKTSNRAAQYYTAVTRLYTKFKRNLAVSKERAAKKTAKEERKAARKGGSND